MQFCPSHFPPLCTASCQQFVQQRCWQSSPHFLIFHRFFILCPVLTTQLLFFKACHDKAVLFFFFTFFNIFISYLLLETE